MVCPVAMALDRVKVHGAMLNGSVCTLDMNLTARSAVNLIAATDYLTINDTNTSFGTVLPLNFVNGK